MSRPLSILIVAYFYPPCRDTGARRPSAMAHHLAELGHKVTVLTTAAYNGGGIWRGDRKRGAERDSSPISAAGHIHVERTGDFHLIRSRMAGHDRVDSMFDSPTYSGKPHFLSRLIGPEPLLGAWVPLAIPRARSLARRTEFDVVLTTSPPESAHAIGLSLQRHHDIPWVADIRDAWIFEPLRPPWPTRFQDRIDERMERRWFSRADTVVCVSAPAAAELRDKGVADPLLVTNGWDPAADPGSSSVDAAREMLDPARVSLVCTGRFGSYGRDPGPFVDALLALSHEHPDEASKLEVALAGPLTEAEDALFDTVPAPVKVSKLGSFDHPTALALQKAADALFFIAMRKRSQLANYRMFEYLAAGPPILALAEGTEAGRICADAGCEVVRGDRPEEIVPALRKVVAGEIPAPRPDAKEHYSYPAVAEQMANAMRTAIERRRG